MFSDDQDGQYVRRSILFSGNPSDETISTQGAPAASLPPAPPTLSDERVAELRTLAEHSPDARRPTMRDPRFNTGDPIMDAALAADDAKLAAMGAYDDEPVPASLPPAPPTLSDEDMTAEEKTLVRLRAENESLRAEVAALRKPAPPPKVTCQVCQRERPYHDMYRCFQCQGWFDEPCMAAHLATTRNVGGDRVSAARSSAAGEDTDG